LGRGKERRSSVTTDQKQGRQEKKEKGNSGAGGPEKNGTELAALPRLGKGR